jgi:putative transposase
VLQRLEQRRAGEDVEVPWTLPALRREWNRAKHQVAPWWAENSKEAYSSGLDGLARGLTNFSDYKAGRRKGGGWAFHDPSEKAVPGTPAALPPARSEC